MVQHLSWKTHLRIIKASVGVFQEKHFKQKIEISNMTKCNNGRTNNVFELKQRKWQKKDWRSTTTNYRSTRSLKSHMGVGMVK